MAITFESGEKWNGDRFGMTFWAKSNGRDIRCFATREFLLDRFGASVGEGERRAFEENRDEVQAIAAALISKGETHAVEDDIVEVVLGRNEAREAFVVPVLRIVRFEDVEGSQIQKRVDDLAWWSQVAAQPVDAVEITFRNDGRFDDAVITFPSSKTARHFDYVMGNFGVRTHWAIREES